MMEHITLLLLLLLILPSLCTIGRLLGIDIKSFKSGHKNKECHDLYSNRTIIFQILLIYI